MKEDTKEERFVRLMAKSPRENARRIIELEDALESAYITIGKLVAGEIDINELLQMGEFSDHRTVS